MRPTTRRLFLIAVLIFISSVVGLVLALILQWPTQLGGSGEPNITAEEFVAKGTVTSLPLYSWMALTVFAQLARSRRWWGTVAVVFLCLLGALFIFGGLGEAFAPPAPHVPRAVLVASGVVYGGLGLAQMLSGIADLIDRARVLAQVSGSHGEQAYLLGTGTESSAPTCSCNYMQSADICKKFLNSLFHTLYKV